MAGGSSLDNRLRDAVGDHVPGIAVAVVDAEGIREAVGVGLADITDERLASPQMVCPWFSMTKIATATAAMRLREHGVLDLDAPLAALVPQMQHLRPTSYAARITARNFLSHSAGLANPVPVGWIHPPDNLAPTPTRSLKGCSRSTGAFASSRVRSRATRTSEHSSLEPRWRTLRKRHLQAW